MPSPIPLMATRNNKEVMSGTGFVARRGEVNWLITCLHIISGGEMVKNGDTNPLATGLVVFGTDSYIPLNSQITKRRYSLVNNDTDHILYDVLALPLDPNEINILSRFGVYDGSSFVEVKEGDSVTTEGFPDFTSKPPVPIKQTSNVSSMYGEHIKLSKPTKLGMSGSPATTDAGLVGVSWADAGEPSNFTNGLVLSLHKVGPILLSLPI